MNARILKKLCKRAAHIFRAMKGVQGELYKTDGDEAYRCANFDRKHKEKWHGAEHPINGNSHDYVCILKNTFFCAWRCSHEYDEYEAEPAYEVLKRLYFDAHTNYELLAKNIEGIPLYPTYTGIKNPNPSIVFKWAEQLAHHQQ